MTFQKDSDAFAVVLIKFSAHNRSPFKDFS